jgi:hypothetical protein
MLPHLQPARCPQGDHVLKEPAISPDPNIAARAHRYVEQRAAMGHPLLKETV